MISLETFIPVKYQNKILVKYNLMLLSFHIHTDLLPLTCLVQRLTLGIPAELFLVAFAYYNLVQSKRFNGKFISYLTLQ